MQHEFYDRDDGLAHCKICGGAEGSLTTACPGRRLAASMDDAVYAGDFDFNGASWVAGAKECMPGRPVSPLTMVVIVRFSPQDPESFPVAVAAEQLREALRTVPTRWSVSPETACELRQLFASLQVKGLAVGFSLLGCDMTQIAEMVEYVHARIRPGMNHVYRAADGSCQQVEISHVLAGQRGTIARFTFAA